MLEKEIKDFLEKNNLARAKKLAKIFLSRPNSKPALNGSKIFIL